MKNSWRPIAAALMAFAVCPPGTSRAQEGTATPASDRPQLTVEHAECVYFGEKRDKYVGPETALAGAALSTVTEQVTTSITPLPGGSRSRGYSQAHQPGSIDSYILAALQAANVKPADKTSDWEFIRRVTLDLTGRIPAPDRVLAFVSDSSSAKRAKLIDELLAKPEWTDKWAMYFGDLYKNTSNSVQVRRYNEGRNAFYKWIHDSLTANKPYNQMATELIAAQGNNSFDQSQGNINWLAGGIVGGGPVQDIYDQQAADVAETFLGITHMNCLLCHNGRGHLDALSLWGKTTNRYQAWQFASFLSRTNVKRLATPADPNNPKANQNYYYYSLATNTVDYPLNTTSGNRPARLPVGTEKNVAPVYFFNGAKPNSGEDYRTALARSVTNDPQFARATVNYIWKEFFGRGIVDPPNQFDPARLDPDNPPPDPWTLQASNPRLLNALALRFIENGYDLQALMREIANSDTYQLSARYAGTWDSNNDKLFGRKFVRRLWAEEVHDAVVQASGIVPSYSVPGFTADSTTYGVTSPGFGKISFAMQLPEVVNLPDGNGAVSQFLDSFLRGDRDDNPRRSEGSILQALNLMNDNFIESRIHATGTATQNGIVAKSIKLVDEDLVNAFFLNVLSRYPTGDEKATAIAKLQAGAAAGNRTAAVEDLLWSLFNKVDFVFNY